MEVEQILKHLDWLDSERRKDKDVIARQEERMVALDGNLTSAHQLIKDLRSDLTRFSSVSGRIDQLDNALLQQRIETTRQGEELDKLSKKRDEEMEKVRRLEMRAIDTNIAEIRKGLEPIEGLKRSIQARVDEEIRLGHSIDELQVKIQEMRRGEEEYNRTYRMLEDGRRQDVKRLVDLTGEVSATRKRVDEQRGQVELFNTGLRKVESRLNELFAVEIERRDAQAVFLDKQNLVQVERDRIWKEWSARFDAVEIQIKATDTQLQILDNTQRSLKRDKDILDELTQRVERRINEITEMQRLSDERFRQEWVTFRGDDQKRWTNYTLTQDEQRSEITRHIEKIVERLTQVEDRISEMRDFLQLINEQTEKRLQGLLALTHDWVSVYGRDKERSR